MRGNNFLLDTNAVLYYLAGNECMRPYIKKDFSVSVITEMELLSFPKITNEEEKRIRFFLDRCEIIPINLEIKDKTIELRRKYASKLPDSIIAATAMEKGLTLVTADVGFKKMGKIKTDIIIPQ